MGFYGTWPQVQDANSPLALGTFFSPQSDDLLDYTGYSGLNAVKWVGKGNKGGCKLFFDCGSSKDKASCQAQGGVCVWQKYACVESSQFIEGVRNYYSD